MPFIWLEQLLPAAAASKRNIHWEKCRLTLFLSVSVLAKKLRALNVYGAIPITQFKNSLSPCQLTTFVAVFVDKVGRVDRSCFCYFGSGSSQVGLQRAIFWCCRCCCRYSCSLAQLVQNLTNCIRRANHSTVKMVLTSSFYAFIFYFVDVFARRSPSLVVVGRGCCCCCVILSTKTS